MNEEIDLNQYEERLFEIIKEHPGISDAKAAELADLSKETTSKYLESLRQYGLAEFQRLKQNEKAWFVSTKIFPSFNVLREKVIEDFDIMESKIKKSLELVENGSLKEVIYAYRATYGKVFGFRNFITFLITTNRFRKHPKHWLDLQKRIDSLLEELAEGVDDSIAVNIMVDLAQKDSEASDELSYILKFMQNQNRINTLGTEKKQLRK